MPGIEIVPNDHRVANHHCGRTELVDGSTKTVEVEIRMVGVEADHLTPGMHPGVRASGTGKDDRAAEHPSDGLAQHAGDGSDSWIHREA